MYTDENMLRAVTEILPEEILSRYTPKEVISVDSGETLVRAAAKKNRETVTIRITEKTADAPLPSDLGRGKQKGKGSAPAEFANEDFYFAVIPAEPQEREGKKEAAIDDAAEKTQEGRAFFSDEKKLFGNKRPLYALLFVCAAVMVFSAYHFAANRQESAREISGNFVDGDTGGESEMLSAENTVSNPEFSEDEFEESEMLSAEDTAGDNEFGESYEGNGSAAIVSDTDRILDISDTGFSDSSFLADVSSPEDVRILIAGGCQFADAGAFVRLENVEEIYLNGNPIASTQGFDRLENLSVLVLSDCSGDLETADSADSAGSVSPAGLTDVSDLSFLESLTILDLSHNTSLENIRSLCLLQNLELLILTNTNVSESDVEYLKESLPHCTVIY